MADPEAFFVPVANETFRATELTRGPWSADHQHGGPTSALLARAIESLAGPDMAVVRMTVEFTRPIPIGELALTSEVVRPGRKLRIVKASLASGADEVCRASAVCVRTTKLALASTGAPDPAPVPPPEELVTWSFPFFRWPVGYQTAMEVRVGRGVFGEGRMAAWMRMRIPLLPGESPTPLQRVMAAADSANGVGVAMDIDRWTFINPDLTVVLHRPLEGEWVCLDTTTIAHPSGIGMTDTQLRDPRGPIGRSNQTLLVEAR